MSSAVSPGTPQPTDCPNPEIHSVNGGPMRYCTCGWSEDPPDRIGPAVAAAIAEAGWEWNAEPGVPSPEECMRPIVEAAINAWSGAGR